jgi:hypothetical protein
MLLPCALDLLCAETLVLLDLKVPQRLSGRLGVCILHAQSLSPVDRVAAYSRFARMSPDCRALEFVAQRCISSEKCPAYKVSNGGISVPDVRMNSVSTLCASDDYLWKRRDRGFKHRYGIRERKQKEGSAIVHGRNGSKAAQQHLSRRRRIPRNLSSRLTRMRHALATPSHVSSIPRFVSSLSIRQHSTSLYTFCYRKFDLANSGLQAWELCIICSLYIRGESGQIPGHFAVFGMVHRAPHFRHHQAWYYLRLQLLCTGHLGRDRAKKLCLQYDGRTHALCIVCYFVLYR